MLVLGVLAVLPFLLTYDTAADGFGKVTERAPFSDWARDHGALYGLFAYLVATAYAIRLVRSHHPWRTAGVDARGDAVRRLAAGGGQPRRGRRRCVALCAGRGARGVRQPRPGRRALRLGADRRRAAVPRDPRARLRQGLVRRQRALPHEHGLQARLPGVAAAGDRGGADDRVELGLARPARAASRQLAWALPLLVLLVLAAVYPVAGTYARKGGFADAPHLGGLRWLEESSPGDPAAIEWLNENAPQRLGRARGGRRRLLRVRPRADLDLHRAADRDGLGRPRAPVGARPGHAPPGRRGDLPRGGPRRAPARCSSATTSATSSSARSSARATATPASRSGTSSGAACSTATARRSGSCGDRPRRPARGVGAAGLRGRGRRGRARRGAAAAERAGRRDPGGARAAV